MPKVTPRTKDSTVYAKTKNDASANHLPSWWEANSKKDLSDSLIATAGFLKERSQYMMRQAGIYARLYGNMPLMGAMGGQFGKISPTNSLPIDRPTMNVISSCIDTLVSRIAQSRPRPIFLTDNADYKERTLAKDLNSFIAGELFQTKAYSIGELILRDAAVWGVGCIKILEDSNKRVALERTHYTELMVDPSDSYYGDPRQLYQFKLVDRSVLSNQFPEYRSSVQKAEQAYPDSSAESEKTVSDLVMVVEGWRLPSGKDTNDGRHSIACSAGVLFDEEWSRDTFPFVFLHYTPPLVGFWGRGLCEALMGTQIEINKLLMTISQSINLVGVPRVFVEDGSKVVKAHLNNNIGAIVTYRGTKPTYEVAPCVPQELYGQLQRLVEYAYQQSGISALAAASQKPAGLNSGAAVREYDDLQSDRFAALNKRFDNMYIDLSYQIIVKAMAICERDGKYQTVFLDRNGTKQVNLPSASRLKDPFVIQCFDESSLPRDPAGRAQKIIEFMQSGLYTPQEGRRLLGFSDTEQVDKLQVAAEERILKILDEIVESGTYTPPDKYMDLMKANELVTQYYNLYLAAGLEESKASLLRMFDSQLQALVMAASPPAPVQMPAQMGNAAPLPTSDLIPNVTGAA